MHELTFTETQILNTNDSVYTDQGVVYTYSLRLSENDS